MTGFPQLAIDYLKTISSIQPLFSQTSNITVTPSITTVSTKIISANPARKGIVIYNNSANSVYICYAGPATSAGCHLILATFATYNMLGPIIWQGDLYAIRNSGSGALNIVELL